MGPCWLLPPPPRWLQESTCPHTGSFSGRSSVGQVGLAAKSWPHVSGIFGSQTHGSHEFGAPGSRIHGPHVFGKPAQQVCVHGDTNS